MSRKITRGVMLALAFVFFVGVFIYNAGRMYEYREAMQQVPAAQEALSPTVAVVEVAAATHRAQVDGVGSAKARFELALNSRVSGQVEAVDDSFESGRLVTAGSVLANLEDSLLRASVESARNTLASARVSYLEEQQASVQAQKEWSSSGLSGEPMSALVLREPQLTAAKAVLDSAQQALAAAEKDLASTRIRAPFDAIVVSRDIAPGSYLQAGSEIGQLLSAERVEIAVPLSAQQWSVLPDESELLSGHYAVVLSHTETGKRWTGHAIRTEKHLSSSTRQRSLVVAVDQPLSQDPPLYPGAFLNVLIPGSAMENLWQLPASARSQRGEIWTVTDDSLLKTYAADIRFSDQEHIYVTPPEGYQKALVVVQPLSSYSEGMKVNPQKEQFDE
ncbi:efflux RND transporter periplasmic adaptor subunit [Halopseudomonas pelagia]|uniref:efflux RND transporter periplasmic adaptor subunit n=2 Tax=Halopseudomonas pelagia TaxID=553151 RepID=UPI0003A37C32|tara:strand:- start:34797 stop:35966 length:1170 start_codon:yes stop_codon:yes gene_type:complete